MGTPPKFEDVPATDTNFCVVVLRPHSDGLPEASSLLLRCKVYGVAQQAQYAQLGSRSIDIHLFRSYNTGRNPARPLIG